MPGLSCLVSPGLHAENSLAKRPSRDLCQYSVTGVKLLPVALTCCIVQSEFIPSSSLETCSYELAKAELFKNASAHETLSSLVCSITRSLCTHLHSCSLDCTVYFASTVFGYPSCTHR